MWQRACQAITSNSHICWNATHNSYRYLAALRMRASYTG